MQWMHVALTATTIALAAATQPVAALAIAAAAQSVATVAVAAASAAVAVALQVHEQV